MSNIGRATISKGRNAPILERFAHRAQRTFRYKRTPQGELSLTIHFPYDHTDADSRPGALFFFGGGFVAGTREQFTRQCSYLSAHGIVAATADYRVRSYHGTSVAECFDDAVAALRWFRWRAPGIGVDPNRILVGGGSAGGTLAAFLGAYRSTGGEDVASAIRPNALALLNPAFGIRDSDLEKRLGLSARDIEALDFDHTIGADYPPTWMWYGSDDSIYERSRPTVERMKRDCPRIELVVEDGADHGYFNDFEPYFRSTLASLSDFLRSLGYVE